MHKVKHYFYLLALGDYAKATFIHKPILNQVEADILKIKHPICLFFCPGQRANHDVQL